MDGNNIVILGFKSDVVDVYMEDITVEFLDNILKTILTSKVQFSCAK
jgi:hypothetical protein